MASATIPVRSRTASLPSGVSQWSTDRLSDEAVRAIQTCRKHGQAAARSAWEAGAYLSLLHSRLIKGRKWATWLRSRWDLITEYTARRYILLYERSEGRATELDGMTLTEAYAIFGITRFVEPAVIASPSSGAAFGTGGADHRCQAVQSHAPKTDSGEARHLAVVPTETATLDEAEEILSAFDEDAILQAAADIRQRRVAEKLREIQERRQKLRPGRISKCGSPVLHGDCLDLIPSLDDGSVSLVVTSPPYAEQRVGHYESVPEEDYPDFTVNWMTALAPKMTPDGSVFVVIRPHLRAGVISDYVLRTRLTLREAGWNECEELIWLKPGAPPLGSLKRPTPYLGKHPVVQQEHAALLRPQGVRQGIKSDRVREFVSVRRGR